jgi:hypothetical protein
MIRRLLISVVISSAIVIGSARISVAQGEGSFRDLATADDFRLRVAAALALGKSKHPNARPALEKALDDSHPAVRASAAVGLGLLGDPGAVAALRTAAGKESAANVKSQIQSTIQRLSVASSASPSVPTKFLVVLSRLDNRSGINDSGVVSAFKTAARSRVAQVPGVELLADGTDVGTASKSRRLPAFALDGSLTQLTKASAGSDVAYAAKVTFVIRRMPGQTLKGTISGAAQAQVDARAVKKDSDLSQLQLDAVSAAIESACKAAPPALEAAAIK